MKHLSQWRTVIAVVVLGSMLLAGWWLACSAPETSIGAVATMFSAFAWAVVGLGVAVAGKSGVEHLAGGGGIKGVVAALFTNAKPEPPIPTSER